MIQGYPETSSIYPGENIILYVSTDQPQFQIDFYRQGVTLDLKFTSDVFKGVFAPDHSYEQDWGQDDTDDNGNFLKGWMAYAVGIPDNLQTGVYIAMFYECDANGNRSPNQAPAIDTRNSYAPTGKAMFIVMNPNPGYDSQVLYKIPSNTYQAYNWTGGNSIYQSVSTSFSRPGTGTGGVPWDSLTGNEAFKFNQPYGNWDPYDNYLLDPANHSPRQVFEHWDAKFISFLEGLGYRIDYCTDMDVHNDDGQLLRPYSLVLSVGHDEYYTVPMRENLDDFVAGGGNIAFFSGNTCYWQAQITDGTPQMMIGQQTISKWFQVQPENGLTGVAFLNAGERDACGAPEHDSKVDLGYTVQYTKTWPFENTGLKDGGKFGGDHGLAGYECDGAVFDDGSAKPYQPKPGFNTPAGFQILGYADTNAFTALGQDLTGNNSFEIFGDHYATMGMFTSNGTVFTGATTDWPRVAWEGEPKTAQITQNVINRLGGNPKGLAELSNISNIICCDGFYSGDDKFRHAIVGDADGNITEIFFNPDEGEGQTVIWQIENLIDLGAFFTTDDQQRHVITIDPTGTVTEIYYNPNTGLAVTPVGNLAGAERVCAYYSSKDHFRHAIVSTDRGIVYDLRYGKGAPTQTQVGAFDDIVDIGCFYSPDDSNGHVIVATADGAITEIYYDADYHISQTQIAMIEGATKVSAYYATEDKFFTRRAQVLGSDGRIHEIRYGLHTKIVHVILMNLWGVTDIGGFYSDDDGFSHAILSYDSGDVRELFFNP